jgi:hypothetical protein
VKLDSNKIKTGTYIVSLHYYYQNNTWKDVLCHLLITKRRAGNFEWDQFLPVRVFSGFYEGYAVFEYKVDLERETNYEFIMKSSLNHFYKVSDFMLRPEGTTVKMVNGKGETVFNNFEP